MGFICCLCKERLWIFVYPRTLLTLYLSYSTIIVKLQNLLLSGRFTLILDHYFRANRLGRSLFAFPIRAHNSFPMRAHNSAKYGAKGSKEIAFPPLALLFLQPSSRQCPPASPVWPEGDEKGSCVGQGRDLMSRVAWVNLAFSLCHAHLHDKTFTFGFGRILTPSSRCQHPHSQNRERCLYAISEQPYR